jgi:acylphosphatase
VAWIAGIIARVNAGSASDRARLHAVVTGFVQGVSFRYYTQRKAGTLGVAGWVRNRGDGSVEVMAEGSRTALVSLAAFLKTGPPSAQVSHVELAWLEPTGEFLSFDVRY